MLALAAKILALAVAVAHFGFMYLEMVLWTKPAGRKIFGNDEDKAAKTKVLAANQGIYNGALAGCLAWAVLTGNTPAVMALLVFVIVVGVYGAMTASKTILFVQALPAAVALVVTGLAHTS